MLDFFKYIFDDESRTIGFIVIVAIVCSALVQIVRSIVKKT